MEVSVIGCYLHENRQKTVKTLEEYLERREEEEAKLTNKLTDGRNKQNQDKAAGQEMRERALERLAQTKKRKWEGSAAEKASERLNFLRVSAEGIPVKAR